MRRGSRTTGGRVGLLLLGLACLLPVRVAASPSGHPSLQPPADPGRILRIMEVELDRDLDRRVRDLEQLREAPLTEPYTGPAILLNRSAGVFFHEVFGPRGHPWEIRMDGRTGDGIPISVVAPDVLFEEVVLAPVGGRRSHPHHVSRPRVAPGGESP
ncbi:MAG: hypothetical protein R6W82_06140 [bacterium]